MGPVLFKTSMVGRASLVVGAVLLIFALSIDWCGDRGVMFGKLLLDNGHESQQARYVGVAGYAGCVVGLLASLTDPLGIRRLAVGVAGLLMLGCLLGSVGLVNGFESPMKAGFPLFCAAIPPFFIGLIDHWPVFGSISMSLLPDTNRP